MSSVKALILICVATVLMVSMQIDDADADSNNTAMQTEMERQYFESVQQLLPLNREMVNNFKQRQEEVEKALHEATPAELVTQSQVLTLETGVTPPTINLTPGYVSSILLIDSTGKPWPITSVTVGNPDKFSVQKPEVEPGNLLTIVPLTSHAGSNLIITLENKDFPATLELKTISELTKKKRIADALISLQVNEPGPHAMRATVGQPLPEVVGSVMLTFLDGVPPTGAQYMDMTPEIKGVDAWSLGQKIYVRTKYAAMWPAWTAVANGAGGMRVYEMQTVPSIMVSLNGVPTTISFDGE